MVYNVLGHQQLNHNTAGKHCRQKCKDVFFYMALPRVPLPIALVPNDYLDDNQLLK